MAQELQSMAVSAFCENMAMLLAAGIGPEEGTALLSDTGVESEFHDAAKAVHDHLTANGGTLADACAATGYFPGYACRMLAAGELTGRTEQVLRGLARYYADRARFNKQLRSAVAYPAVLLCLMAVILAVLLVQVLPVFSRVYAAMAGGTAAAGYRYLQVGYVVGGVALAVTAVIAAVLAVTLLQARTARGRVKLEAAAEKIPALRGVVRKQALARYVWVLDLYLASGMPAEDSLRAAAEVVTCGQLKKAARGCADAVAAGKPLEEAVLEQQLFEPLYARMLVTGAKSGAMDQVVTRLSELFSEDAAEATEHLTGLVEPVLSGLLTLAVGVTLIAAMLPLVGMLGAIG